MSEPGRCIVCDLQTVMPLAVSLQTDLLGKYGFSKDMMGAMQMIMAIRMAAMADPEMMAQVVRLQGMIMPSSVPKA
jgi:hypothetical protein